MNVEIAERLAARRKQAGLSQEALAEQLGVSRQAVSKWERSESSPDTDNLIALARLYGVSLDDLLYVDGAIEDDVAFEAADRAAANGVPYGAAGAGVAGAAGAAGAAAADGAGFGAADAGAADAAAGASAGAAADAAGGVRAEGKVHIGLDGIHVKDGDDYVHVTWRDGVHVKDSKKGEEVHVGWGGIHVTDPKINVTAASAEGVAGAASPQGAGATASPASNPGVAASAAAVGAAAASAGGVRTGAPVGTASASDAAAAPASAPGTVPADTVIIDDAGVTAADDEGNSFTWGEGGVVINGEHFDSWHDAKKKHGPDGPFNEPCGYTVCGQQFDTVEEAREVYGPEVGRSIPVRKRYLNRFGRAWVRFPFPVLVLLAYIVLGLAYGTWGIGLFLAFTIPLYYMIGAAVGKRRLAPLLAGAYPLCAVAWFLYMAFVLNAWHPAWVVFLTIPLAEWLIVASSHAWRRARRKDDVIDVPAE